MTTHSIRAAQIILLSCVFLATSVARIEAQAEKKESSPSTPKPNVAVQRLIAPIQSPADPFLQSAFEGKESTRSLRMWFPNRGLVLATDRFEVLSDNQVLLKPFSAALVADAKTVVQTIRGHSAVITLDRAIKDFTSLGTAQVKAIDVNVGAGVILPFPTQVFADAETAARPNLPGLQVFEVIPSPRAKTPISPAAPTIRFHFNIDAKSSLAALLPTAPNALAKLPSWANEDLTKVSELAFGDPISKELPTEKAMEATAHMIAKINHLNQKKTDGFVFALIAERADLRGLPFLMGQECRTREEQARMFAAVVEIVRPTLGRAKENATNAPETDSFFSELGGSVQTVNAINSKGANGRSGQTDPNLLNRAAVAALTQILMPESESLRLGLAKFLATVPHIDATKALAKLAIFSPEESVRRAAVEGLKLRREKDYTRILMQGFRYPLPAVPKRSAEALVKLECKDVTANLVEVLEQPDPRLPVTEKRDGQEVSVVRELVRVNHHRNCLLCHAPGNTDSTPEGVLKVAVPLPGEPLSKPSEGYQSTPPPSPDIVVRLDMTYLRQDFSLMMPVNDAHPWPEMQRFDFLVRTRTLTPQDTQAYEACCDATEPGRLSPYHRAALFALRELTGRDTEPTPAAWRRLLKLPSAR